MLSVSKKDIWSYEIILKNNIFLSQFKWKFQWTYKLHRILQISYFSDHLIVFSIQIYIKEVRTYLRLYDWRFKSEMKIKVMHKRVSYTLYYIIICEWQAMRKL